MSDIPDLKHDLSIVQQYPHHFIVGMDEVGRGAIAGPVTMAVAALNYADFVESDVSIRDSKKLSPADRDSIVSFYENDGRESLIYSRLVDCGADSIDACGIETALDKCFESLIFALHSDLEIPYDKIVVLLDGNHDRSREGALRDVTCLLRPKADDFYMCTALASVFAKVRRDADMRVLHGECPHYGWDSNKGYGGTAHRDKITELGLTPYHRRTFIH